MPNQLFNMVTSELEVHLGDILATGITKKAVRSIGCSEDEVTKIEMKEALNKHVRRSLGAFMVEQKTYQVIKNIERKMEGVAE